MTLLQIVQEFCRRQGLTVPSIIASSNDEQLTQLMGLANEICDDLVGKAWTALQYEATFTSVAGSDQGTITTLAPNQFLSIINETIFDRTRRLPLFGPRSPRDWQAQAALQNSGPFYQYRIKNGHLYTQPDMPDGNSMAFEYQSSGCVQDNTDPLNPTYKTYFTRDDDTFLLDDSLLLLGLRWRWKEEKGLPYAESFRIYEEALADALGKDGTKPTLSMNGGQTTPRPGIFVPAGDWNLP